MRLNNLILCVLVPCLLLSLCRIPVAYSAEFRDYNTFMTSFKSLAVTYPQYVSYETIGKTVENRDIIMFKIGNPNGGRVMFDGAIHGMENLGSELLYLYATWLLASPDPLATRILSRDYTLLVPAVNVDEYDYGRKNAHGVDLNRNFATSWQYAGSSDPNSDYYRGPSPVSEPESQAIVRVFQTWKPSAYINLHRGGEILYGNSYGNTTYTSEIYARMDALADQRIVNRYAHQNIGAAGYAMSDATMAGAAGFLLELIDWQILTLPEIETRILPRFITIAAVLSQECESTTSFPNYDVDQNGQVNMFDIAVVARAFCTTPGSPYWNPQADLNKDAIVDMHDIGLVARHFGEVFT